MAVKTVSIKALGRDYKISPHFKLSEMACKDGSDKVLYSTELMAKLEELRAYGGFTVSINSGYRTPAYNKKIGGASRSQHVLGTAADIVVKKNGIVVSAKKVCCLCQSLGFNGIGYISANAVHVDTRASGSYRGDERRGYGGNVSDFYRYFSISKAEIEALKASQEAVKTTENKEDNMTQDQFNAMMNNWISQQAAKEPHEWSVDARKWAEENNIITGTGAGFSYLAGCDREMTITFLYRLYNLLSGGVSDAEGEAMINAMIKALEGLKK